MLTIIGAGEKVPVAAATPLRYGDGRLVVWGMRTADVYWHIARRGSWSPPTGNTGTDLVVGRSQCGEWISMNGYCSDFMPPAWSICPACRERL